MIRNIFGITSLFIGLSFAGSHLWATSTGGNPGAHLAIQNDGNLVVYNATGATALWASNTGGHY